MNIMEFPKKIYIVEEPDHENQIGFICDTSVLELIEETILEKKASYSDTIHKSWKYVCDLEWINSTRVGKTRRTISIFDTEEGAIEKRNMLILEQIISLQEDIKALEEKMELTFGHDYI